MSELWNEKPESHWHWLCDEVYTATDFFEISKTNATNRKQQKYHHAGGAKPFIQHAKNAHKEEMKEMRNVLKAKLIQEAPEGSPSDSVVVHVDDEFGILCEKLERKGRSIRGVGTFPRMEVSNSHATSSSNTTFELNVIQDQLKQLSTNMFTVQKENEELKEQLRVVLVASQGRQQLNNARGRFNVLPDDLYYDEFPDHHLDD